MGSDKEWGRIQRHRRVRKKVTGTAERPRVAVHRSLKNLFVQAIDDDFLLAAVITMVSAIPVIFLKIGRKGKGKNSGNGRAQHQSIGSEEPLQPLTTPSEARN